MHQTGSRVPGFPGGGACRFALAVASLAIVVGCVNQSHEDLVQAAERHLAENDDRTAQIELKNAIKLAPGKGRPFLVLAKSLLRTGDAAAAESALRQALLLHTPPDDVLPLLAFALLAQGESERLLAELADRSLPNRTANASLKACVGKAWLSKGDVEHAAHAFDESLGALPGYPSARLGHARIAAYRGMLDAAAVLVDEVLAGAPGLAEGHAFKAQLQFARGDQMGAAQSLEHAVSSDASDIPARVSLVAWRIGERKYGDAKALLDAAPSASTTDSRMIHLRSLLALRSGDTGAARDLTARILRQVPEHLPGLTLAGEIELHANNPALAEGFLQKALQVDPRADAARRLLVATYLRLEQPGKAIGVLQSLMHSTEPKDEQLLLLAGEAYLAGGDWTRAAKVLEALHPGGKAYAAARLRLGQIALMRGEFERGIGELQAVSAMASDGHEADRTLVEVHLRRHEPDRALAAAEALTRKEPRSPLGHVLAGAAQLAARHPERARLSFDAALSVDPGYLPAVRGLAEADIAEGRVAETRERAMSLVEKKPGDERVMVAASQLLEKIGDSNAASTMLHEAIAAHRMSLPLREALVHLELRRQRPEAAVAAAVAGAALNPQEPRLVELLAQAQQSAGGTDDSIQTLRKLALLEPTSPRAFRRVAALEAGRHEYGEAARNLQRAQAIAPSDDMVTRDLIAMYTAIGRLDDALGLARTLQERRPSAALGHTMEGDVQVTRERWADAERAYRTALVAEPGSTSVAIRLCRMLTVAGRGESANSLAREWIARRPSDLAMRMYVGDVALAGGDLKIAAAQYEAVLSRAPDHALALNNLAWVLGQLNDPRAFELARRAVELSPGNAAALDTLGMLHLQSGDAKKAMEYLSRVHAIAPGKMEWRLHRAMGLIRTGQAPEARAELHDLLSMQGDFPGKADIERLLRTF